MRHNRLSDAALVCSLTRDKAAAGSPQHAYAPAWHGPSATGRYSSRRLNRAFVANTASDTVSLLDAKTGNVVRTIHVGQDPAAGDRTTGRAFVANLGSGTVSVLDDQTGALLHTTTVGK